MKARRFIWQCATVALLLVFSQKVGGGLFLHNLLHGEDTGNLSQPFKQDANSKEISYACNCIDDFSLPFTETEEITLPVPVIEYVHPRTDFVAGITYRALIAAHLRGPPALVL
jgi:hypothetical protein